MTNVILDEQTKNRVQTEINERLRKFIGVCQRGDFDNVFTYYDHEGDGCYIDNYHMYKDFQEVLSSYKVNWDVSRQEADFPGTKVVVLSPAIVITSLSGSSTVTNRAGITFKAQQIVVTFVWTKKDDSWLINSFHQQVSEAVAEVEG